MDLLLPNFGLVFWTIFGVVTTLFLWALIDLLKSSFKASNTKLMWVLILLFIPLLGSVLYLIIGRKQKVQ